MNPEIPIVPLGELCQMDRHGLRPDDPAGSELRFLGVENLESGSGRLNFDSHSRIGTQRSTAFRFDERHVLYGKLRPYLNKVATPGFPGRCSTELVPLLPRDGVERDYLAHLLRREETVEYAMSSVTGTRMPRADMNALLAMPVPFPPLDEQRRIVKMLDEADRLRRLRATADAKADRILRALFLRMFGDPETNPMDWPMRRIADVCEVVTGATPKTGREEYWSGTVAWATPRDLSRLEDWVLDRTERTLTEAGLKSCATTMLPAGSVLLSSRAPIGLVAISGTPLCTNQGFKSLVCGADIDPWYLFAWCRLRTSFLQSLGHGATFKEISKRIVSDIQIALPPLAIQKDFRARIESLRNFRNQARLAGARTNDLFRQLLTRAFSGSLPKDPPTC